MRADGGIFWRPVYPATRKLTLPFITRGFLLPDDDEDDALLPDLLLLFIDGIEVEISWARSLVSNRKSGFRWWRDMSSLLESQTQTDLQGITKWLFILFPPKRP